MKRREWILCGFATILVAAYLFWMPGYLAGEREELTLQNQRENPETFSGVISLWHIVGFKPYQGSMGAWLSDRAAAFEKKHFGVFINVTAMTPEECEERLQRGERADAYSFPMGWGYAERFAPLPEVKGELLPALAPTGRQGGAAYAVPYAMSGYFLLVNSRLEQEKGVSLPEEAWREGLQSAVDALTYTYGKKEKQRYGLSGDPLQAALLGLKCKLAPYDSFKSEDAAMALSDIRAVGDLERLQGAGKGFTFRAWPVGNYTDLVQYLAIARDTEEAKLPYIQAYFELILRADHQATLLELGLLPVTVPKEEKQAGQAAVAALQGALAEPRVPNAFLYQRYQDALADLAQRVLAGDAAAETDLAGRMKELLVMEAQIQ